MASVTPAAAGASVQGVFCASTGQLFLPRVQVGSTVYNIQFKLIDASTMVFQLVRETLQLVSGGVPAAGGSGASSQPQGQLTNNFKSLYGGFIPSVKNEVGIRVPGDATYQQTPWFPIKLPETDMQISPVPGTTREVIASGQFVLDKIVANCRVSYRFHINLRDSQPKRLSLTGSPNSPYSGSYMNIECNTPVTSNNRSWNLTLSSMVTGGLDVGLTLNMTGDSTGEATLSVKGEAKVPAMLLSGTSLQNSNAIQFGDSDFAIDSTTNLEVLADGGVTANGVQVKAPTSASGGSSGTGGTGTDGTGGTGGATGACVNQFTVSNLVSYWGPSQLTAQQMSNLKVSKPTERPFTDDQGDSGQAIILTSDLTVDGVPRFQVQLLLPRGYEKRDYQVKDTQTDIGFDRNGDAIVKLIYSTGTDRYNNQVNDTFWSNKDWGSGLARQGQSVGTITITSVSPKLTGTFSTIRLTGDGGTNNLSTGVGTGYYASISNGSFCIDR